MLRPALAKGQEWSEVVERIEQGQAQLWLGEQSAMVTEIVGDAIHVWLGGGSLPELLEMRPLVEKAGREWGCKRATICGRLGWDRALKEHGFTRVLEKTL